MTDESTQKTKETHLKAHLLLYGCVKETVVSQVICSFNILLILYIYLFFICWMFLAAAQIIECRVVQLLLTN
jgi:hypothetical protein